MPFLLHPIKMRCQDSQQHPQKVKTMISPKKIKKLKLKIQTIGQLGPLSVLTGGCTPHVPKKSVCEAFPPLPDGLPINRKKCPHTRAHAPRLQQHALYVVCYVIQNFNIPLQPSTYPVIYHSMTCNILQGVRRPCYHRHYF